MRIAQSAGSGQLVEFGDRKSNQFPFVVMELIEGVSLHDQQKGQAAGHPGQVLPKDVIIKVSR